MLEIQTKKLYYGSPVYLVGYQDFTHGHNFSTMSSSYSIDDMIVCGMEKNGGAWSNIQHTHLFSVNILLPENIHLAQYGGQNKKENRFMLHQDVKYSIDPTYNVPLIEGALVQFICEVKDFTEFITTEALINVTAQIHKRFAHHDYVREGKLIIEKFKPLTFYADEFDKSLS